MGWNLNRAMSQVLGILRERFISSNATPDSSSCVRINHRGEITVAEEDKIVSLFPDWIRVEFYEEEFECSDEKGEGFWKAKEK